ncbi:MAG: GNAT family N-acetyltransferase [Bdellovibrionaceae bacterium]|nr:GNAT family N-acetyltransferase [Pseudobdellovibrionaceae bacterium]
MPKESQISFGKFDNDANDLARKNLFDLSFPEAVNSSTSSIEHYQWKFAKFPAEPSSYEYIATEMTMEGSKLIGYYAALPFEYKIGDKMLRCGMVCDVMTHPESRGKGVFTGIGKYATDSLRQSGVAFVSGYPVRPEVIPGHLKVGWRIVQKMPMFAKLVSVYSVLPMSVKYLSIFVNPILNLVHSWSHIGLGSYKTQVLSPAEFFHLNDFSYFIKLWISEQSNALIKDIDFLKWRTGAPHAEYKFLTLRLNGNLVGYSLVRPTAIRGYQSLAILDISILSEHFKGSRKLHSTIYELAKALKKDLIVCISSRKWAKNYCFLSSFYLATTTVFSLIIKKLQVELPDENFYFSDMWHLFWIDSDDL